MSHPLKPQALLVASALVAVSSASGQILDFNTFGTAGSDLGLGGVTSSTTGVLRWDDNDGLNGGGALRSVGGNSQFVATTTNSFARGTATSFAVAVFFYFDPTAITSLNDSHSAADRALVIGIKDNSISGVGGTVGNRLDGAANSLWLRVGNDLITNGALTGGFRMMMTLGGRNASVSFNTTDAAANSYTHSTTSGGAAGWFHLGATFTNTALNSWTLSGTLSSASAAGVITGQLDTFSLNTTTGPTLSSLNTYYTALQGSDVVRTGYTVLDNLATPIPEPASFAALAGLGILGFAATRRRRA